MNKKTAKLIATMEAEAAKLNARSDEIDEQCDATGCTPELAAEFEAIQDRLREIRFLIKEANGPKGYICPNTQALVSANID